MFRTLSKHFDLSPERLKRNRSLRWLGSSIERPNLWHINRHSIPPAVAIGLFWGMIPMPMQMLAAALCAIPLRANLPLSVSLVWITNPVTNLPVFYGNYKIGTLLLGTPALNMPENFTFDWFVIMASEHWQPLYLGSFVVGVVLAIAGYVSTKYYWQWKISRNWLKRKRLRQRQMKNKSS